MAMQLGQSYAIDDVRIEDFRGLARTLRVDYSLIHEIIEQLSASIQQQLPKITQDFVTAGFTTTEPIAKHIEHEAAQRSRIAQTK
jgi:hypothetical protein